MGRPRDKRSSTRRAELRALGHDAKPQGVGGRRAPVEIPTGGGGYLGTCTVLNFEIPVPKNNCDDARINELRIMGLPTILIHCAELLGFEAFLLLWRTLDAEPSLRTNKGDLAIRMRPFRSYLRFQRNRYIETLAGAGMDIREIQEQLRRELCEKVSCRHILRIATGR